MRGFALAVICLALMTGCSNVSANEIPEIATATLGYRTNLGLTRQFTLVLKAKEVIVDGLRLSPTQKSWAAPYLTRLLRVSPKSTVWPCAAGNFTHIVKIHGKKTEEQGCLDSVAFAELNRSFEMLQRQAY